MSCLFRTFVSRWACALFGLLSLALPGFGENFAALCADRVAIERVYYHHRLGDKPPFEVTLPRDTLERLVREDLRKEVALKKVYGVEVTPALLEAEVRRINTTTRAPEILAELKTALGHDSARFARTVARPIVVERLLRDKFENDDALHGLQRREADTVREQLLRAKRNGASLSNLLALLRQTHSNAVSETTWQFGARPLEAHAPDADEIEAKKRFGPDAQFLSTARAADKERKFYFSELPRPLQDVLRSQLRQPGEVSAVIEMPGGFTLFLAREKTAEILSVATLSIPKRSYEEWLNEQHE
jgi:hypothetical protein